MTETRIDLLNTLVYQINVLRKDRDIPFKVGIDGVDAAGKTELAGQLLEFIKADYQPVIHTSLDRFHNNKKMRYSLGEKSPEGYYQRSFNYDNLLDSLLNPLLNRDDLKVRTSLFDHKKNKVIKQDPISVSSDTILLFDGIFLSRPKLRKYWDLLIFLHTDFDVILDRVRTRDKSAFKTNADLEETYLKKYIPGQILYLKECQPHLQADILINNNNFDHPYFMVNNREKELFLQHSLTFFEYYENGKK